MSAKTQSTIQTIETIGLIDSVINPYLVKKRKELGLPLSQKALLIWDVFRGQKTQKVCSKLSSLNIEVISVPANMTHFFQPLDVTVNGRVKKFCKNKFAMWYSGEVQKQVYSGINFDDVDVDLKLSVRKTHSCHLVGRIVQLFYEHRRKGLCFERKGKSRNKGCFQWKRSATAC